MLARVPLDIHPDRGLSIDERTFRFRAYRLLNWSSRTGIAIVVTRDGEPIARIEPYPSRRPNLVTTDRTKA